MEYQPITEQQLREYLFKRIVSHMVSAIPKIGDNYSHGLYHSHTDSDGFEIPINLQLPMNPNNIVEEIINGLIWINGSMDGVLISSVERGERIEIIRDVIEFDDRREIWKMSSIVMGWVDKILEYLHQRKKNYLNEMEKS
jgi:hypothetical protein